MIIDLKQIVKDLDGEGIRVTSAAENPMTLKEAVLRSLNYMEGNFKADKKFKRYQVMQAISKDDEPNLTAEEVATVKEAVGEFPWNPLTHGILCDLLDLKLS